MRRGIGVRARGEGGYGVSDIREKTETEENKDDLKKMYVTQTRN